jgi:hypothetical protein
MLNPTLHDGPAEIALMNDLHKKVVRAIYQASGEGLRLWQVQKKVAGTKLEVQESLHELLAAGYIGILSMRQTRRDVDNGLRLTRKRRSNRLILDRCRLIHVLF